MESRIPVPTDNIYKFYALFGLLLFVFACGSVLYLNRSTNEMLYANITVADELRQIDNPTRAQSVKLAVLDKQKAIALSDKQFFIWALGGVGAFSIWMMGYGFRKWHNEVQPILDETAKVQLEIAKLQLEKLRREVSLAPPSQLEP